jgi:ammonia channel protein AmtB
MKVTTLGGPLVEYACTIWDSHTAQNIHKLEAVQRRSARFVMNNYAQSSSITSMLGTLQWSSLEERRARCKAVMMYRIVNGLVAIPPSELHPTSSAARGHTNRFMVPYAKTLIYKQSVFPDGIRIWNSLHRGQLTVPL